MATFSGVYQPVLGYAEVPGLTSSWLGTHPRPAEAVQGRLPNENISGAVASGQPSAVLVQTFSGANQFTFSDDYYNRIWLIPRSLDFGAISNQTQAPFQVWNAQFLTTTLNASSSIGSDEGLTLNLPPLPYAIGPLGLRTLSVTAAAEGPADFSLAYSFSFSVGNTPVLRVTGARARLWQYPVNWSSPYTVTQEYRTDIYRSRSRREQRRAVRQTPRKSVEFQSIINGAQKLREFNRAMAAWLDRPFVVAEAPRRAYMSGPMAQGSTVAPVESVPSWAAPGRTVVIGKGSDMVVSKIDSVATGAITFSAFADRDWPAGTHIYPGLTGMMDMSVSSTNHTNTVSSLTVRLNVNPASEPVEDNGVAAETFEGLEVFLLRPNWGEAVNTDFEREREEIDFGFGRKKQFRPVDFTTQIKKATFVGRTHDEAEEIVRFFRRVKGQAGEFYMPTWGYDITPKSVLPAASNQMRIAGEDFARDYGSDTVHKAFCVVLTNGTRLYRRVSTVEVVTDASGSDTLLTLADVWPYEIALADIELVCWMPVYRLASDTLVVEWITDSVAQVALAMRSQENLL